jgi:multidrug efflux system membrane fusion protein
MTRRRRWGVRLALTGFVAAAGIAAGVGVSTAQHPSPGPSAASRQPIPVQMTKVVRQDVPIYLRGIGTVQAFQQVQVRARVDGYLDKIDFTEGQMVKPGDLLAEIDPRPYEAALMQAQAKKASDQAQLTNAQLDLQRYANLARSDFASRQQLDTQQALVRQYQANLQGDDAAIATAQLNLNFCRITSPIDGVAGLRQIDPGNLVQASAGQTIVTITQVHPISVVFTLPQDRLPTVQAALRDGKPAVLAYSQDGTVELDKGALLTTSNTIDQSTGTFALKAVFPNQQDKLWPGQFVNARLQVAVDRQVVAIPIAALEDGPDGRFVYVVQPDQTVAVQPVTIGYQDDEIAVASSGLTGDEEIVTAGQSRLEPGAKVAAAQKQRAG